MEEDKRDFTAEFKSHVDEFVIHEYEKKLPIRLIDTYTGLLLERFQVIALLKERSDYEKKLWEAISEASYVPDPECPPDALGPSFQDLNAFIKEYLAFAMFSHRWRAREVTIKDVRDPTYTGGIYSIVHPPHHLTEKEAKDFLVGIKKLQEFCCAAAKCGYRWAWADTCCIDEEVFGERSESINSMFLWYRNSDLTVVYLDDVDDVEDGGRLPAIAGDDEWLYDEQMQKPFSPTYPSRETSDNIMTLHKCHQYDPHRLQSMQPDTQVEFGILEHHLEANFPSVPDWKARRRYTKIPEWVTRGWTLQETLAPKRLRFYSKRWTLLEEADDRDTEEAESKIHISSFKFRARLVDHRTSVIWCKALHRTTDIPEHDLVKFEPGTRDVRTRLRWAARRRTTKDEDMAYCLLGIFDVTLPFFHGEGYRAFLRLQEEILKRTGDVSLFDWRGRNSPVNSFLAYSPSCFTEPNLPVTNFDDVDSTASPFRMILNLVRAICGTVWSGVKAVAREVMDWIMHVMKSLPPGHTLVNGELNVPLLEHRVKACEYLENTARNDTYHHYRLKVDGLRPTTVTFVSPDHGLVDDPKHYYLCRVWNRTAHNVFNILLELLRYVLQDAVNDLWSKLTDDEAESSSKENEEEAFLDRMWHLLRLSERDADYYLLYPKSAANEQEDSPQAKLRKEIFMKRREVMRFFRDEFPVYLIRVKDGHRIRVNTVRRVVAEYTKFDFSMVVETRLIL